MKCLKVTPGLEKRYLNVTFLLLDNFALTPQVKKYQKETVLLSFLPKILISAVEEARAESVKDFCFEWENDNFLLIFFEVLELVG